MSYKPTHANSTFTKFGAPEVDKLYNDRYRVIVRCNVKGVDYKWHWDNKENFWKDFGSLYDSPLEIDGSAVGWEPAEGETYDDMRLVRVAQKYPQTPNDGQPIVEFIYETLTSTYVQETDEKVDYELNGLRRVTRTLIAKEDTTYGKTIGTSTIEHTARGYASETLTLASAVEAPKREEEGGFTRIQETWVEAGTLSVSRRNLSEGVQEVTTVFLVTEGSTTGPVIRRSTDNFEGLKTISVTTLQDKDGNSIVEGGTNLVHSFDVFANFSYPGIVTFRGTSTGSYVRRESVLEKAPAQAKVKAKVYVFFSTSNAITSSDYTYDTSSGLWSPNNWASFTIDAVGSTQQELLYDTRAFRGYRSGSTSTTINNATFFGYNGESISDSTSITIDIDIDKGPPNPVGSKWVLDVDVKAAFDDIAGTTYYKKTIIVSDTIPTQISGSLPYDS